MSASTWSSDFTDDDGGSPLSELLGVTKVVDLGNGPFRLPEKSLRDFAREPGSKLTYDQMAYVFDYFSGEDARLNVQEFECLAGWLFPGRNAERLFLSLSEDGFHVYFHNFQKLNRSAHIDHSELAESTTVTGVEAMKRTRLALTVWHTTDAVVEMQRLRGELKTKKKGQTIS
eukprot:GEMP01053134.1.p1 GENE.GEMP01053134.1~~GEMP01053134.1.p1  ORF type:complete len:173 (+),score=41.58 GEMP01053134.1:123-641(+)